MSQIKTLNGVQYTLPQYNDTGWGANTGNVLTQYIAAIADVTLQLTGGAFTLTADTNFGASFGLVSAYFTSRTANAATAGAVRLASADVVSWRNNANGANIDLSKDSSDNLKYNATKVLLSGAVVNADINAAAAIAYSKLALTASIVNADISASAAIAYSKLALSASIVNADVAAAAAIAHSKMAALTASKAPVLDASGFIIASSVTATELGYLSGVTSAIQTQFAATISNPSTADLTISKNNPKLTLNNTSSSDSPYIQGGLAADGYLTLSGGSSRGVRAYYNSGGTLLIDAGLAGVSIRGSNTNDSAGIGWVGEYIETVNTYPNNFPATTVWGDATSISLTAGDWEITAVIYVDNKGVTTTNVIFGISVTSGNSSTGLVVGSNEVNIGLPHNTASQEIGGCIAGYRKSLSATTTIYLKMFSTYSGTTPQFGCRLSARRMR